MKLLKFDVILFSILLFSNFGNSQSCISGIINNYTNITKFDCENSVFITDPNKFKVGDLILIYQTKGATIDNANDTLQYGNIISYNNSGVYEFNRIKKIIGNQVFLNNIPNKTFIIDPYLQMIRVPEYVDIRICSPGIRSDVWDGTKGGVLALSVSGKLIFENDIDVSGNGFRGGNKSLANSTFGVTTEHIGDLELMVNSDKAAQKGEGIGTINFISGRGKWANGGGGGNLHNGGGAGGGNAGKGGNGGNGCELCYGYKEIARGLGANDLNYSNIENRMFLGGGGGGGHRNGFSGSNGADGGGIVIIRANEIVGNNRSIKANGANSNPSIDDGAGGGGAGGTVVLDVNIFTGNLTINVKGGNGGSIISGNDGPGGGGSGGCIWSKLTLPSNIVSQLNGGTAGTRLNNNSTYGAKNGENGKILNGLQISESILKYELPVLNFSVINPNCSGDTTGSIIFQNTNFKYAFNSNPFSSQKSYLNLKGGNYLFSILYDTINLCKYDTIISILDTNKILKTTLSVSQDAICDQLGTIAINTTGGLPPYTNALNNKGYLPTTVYKNLIAGVYKISTKDSNGCNSIDSITIRDNSYTIDLSIEKLIDKSCLDTGSVQFKIQNTSVKNNIYINNFPANNFNYLTPGNYISYVIDSFGCKSDTLKFSIKDNFKNYNFSKNASICEGDTLNFDGNKLTQTGIYLFNYKTKENCDSSITLNLTKNSKSSYSIKKEICSGDFVIIGNKSYSKSGFYKDTLTNSFGCDSLVSLELKVESIQTNLQIDPKFHGQGISCNGKSDGSLFVKPLGGTAPYQIIWSNNSTKPIIDGLSKGKYWVIVKSQTGCVQTDTIELNEPNPITWNLTTSGIKCFGDINGTITINEMYGGNNVYYFSLDGTTYYKSNGFPWVYNHLPAGNHHIKVKDDNGCESAFDAFIADKAPYKIQLSHNDTTIQFGDSIIVTLVNSKKTNKIHWYPKNYVNCDSCIETTIKPIFDFIKIRTIAIDSFGCVDSASILIRTEKDKKVYIPNIFYRESANLNNNIFKIFGSRDADMLNSFRIFDRWGNLVYEENNTTLQNMKGWDGTSNGKLMNPGVYIYQAEVGFKDNTKAIYKGDVMLYE